VNQSLRDDKEYSAVIASKIRKVLPDIKYISNNVCEQELVSEASNYLFEVWKQNKNLNLTAAKNINEMVEKHFIDSIYILKFLNIGGGTLCDIGTGAGFPGIPLKICLPELVCYLLEASRKKINFLKYTVETMKLENIFFLNDRVECVAKKIDYREKFDYVTARALAEMRVLVEIGMPLLKIGGKMLVYKGPKGKTELEFSKKAMEICQGKMIKECKFKLPSGDERIIYVIEKRGTVPDIYPRKPGKPEKDPL